MGRDPIAELVHLYADAVVRYDGDQWSQTWVDDATWDLGGDRRIEGRDDIVAFWHRAMGGFEAVIQTVFNGTYQLDEDAGAGTGRWYIEERFRRVGGDGGLLVAHYEDDYRFDDGRWRFARRALVAHYAGPPDLSVPFLDSRDGSTPGGS